MGSEYTPPEDKCLRGTEVTVENAENLFQSAETLAEAGQYGPACSLMVLAGEEALKALALLGRYRGLEIDSEMESWRSRMMSRHQPRHYFGVWVVLMERILDDMMAAIDKSKERYPEDEEKAREARMEIMKDWADRLTDDDSEEAQKLQEKIDWWDEAEDLKQKGFYVDYGSEGWSSPEDLTEEDFDTAQEVAEQALDLSSFAIEHFKGMTQEEREEFVEIEKEYMQKITDITREYRD